MSIAHFVKQLREATTAIGLGGVVLQDLLQRRNLSTLTASGVGQAAQEQSILGEGVDIRGIQHQVTFENRRRSVGPAFLLLLAGLVAQADVTGAALWRSCWIRAGNGQAHDSQENEDKPVIEPCGHWPGPLEAERTLCGSYLRIWSELRG